MATMNDVARLAGVSNATVSHVINGTRKVNPETVAKVEDAIHQLDFHPNEQARSLKTGQSRLIGVLNYCSVDDYFSEVLVSLEGTAHDAGYDVLIRHTERDGEDQGAAIAAWLNKGIDGLVISSPYITPGFIETLARVTCPCVFLNFYDPAIHVDSIESDDLSASYEAARYLIGLGHRRIACISGWTAAYHTASQRRSGYERALAEAGLPIREEYFISTDYGYQPGFDAMMRLLELPEPPSALLTYSDQLALGAIRAAADRGKSVPRDLSVIGFDDIELASYCQPRLTTIRQDKKQIGELAVRQILKRRQQPDLPPEQIILAARLILRESTAPASQANQ